MSETSKTWYLVCSGWSDGIEQHIEGPYTEAEALEIVGKDGWHKSSKCQVYLQDLTEEAEVVASSSLYKHGDVLLVIWDDAYVAWGWQSLHEVEKLNEDPLSRVASAGLYVSETPESLSLTMGISEHGSHLGVLQIAKKNIVEIKLLEESIVK